MGRVFTVQNCRALRFQNSAFNAMARSPVTLACWAYPYKMDSSSVYLLCGGSISLALSMWNHELFFGIYTTETFGGSVTDGAWNHCAGTFDGATIKAWLNGSTVASTASTENPPANAGFIIGSGWSGGLPFNGVLSDVAVWNLVLSPDEITALARGVSPMRIRPGALVVYVPCVGEARFSDPGPEYDLSPTGGPATVIAGPTLPPLVEPSSPVVIPSATIFTGGGGGGGGSTQGQILNSQVTG